MLQRVLNFFNFFLFFLFTYFLFVHTIYLNMLMVYFKINNSLTFFLVSFLIPNKVFLFLSCKKLPSFLTTMIFFYILYMSNIIHAYISTPFTHLHIMYNEFKHCINKFYVHTNPFYISTVHLISYSTALSP